LILDVHGATDKKFSTPVSQFSWSIYNLCIMSKGANDAKGTRRPLLIHADPTVTVPEIELDAEVNVLGNMDLGAFCREARANLIGHFDLPVTGFLNLGDTDVGRQVIDGAAALVVSRQYARVSFDGMTTTQRYCATQVDTDAE
jgi:hypothetical protein